MAMAASPQASQPQRCTGHPRASSADGSWRPKRPSASPSQRRVRAAIGDIDVCWALEVVGVGLWPLLTGGWTRSVYHYHVLVYSRSVPNRECPTLCWSLSSKSPPPHNVKTQLHHFPRPTAGPKPASDDSCFNSLAVTGLSPPHLLSCSA
ncbi:hypothetical protein MKX07_002335 [Trichoderma sp. CBMAI-0711]|nr:hypothetical protein MKX07_002335 [Trichoderma sp. CBMAI-0711]